MGVSSSARQTGPNVHHQQLTKKFPSIPSCSSIASVVSTGSGFASGLAQSTKMQQQQQQMYNPEQGNASGAMNSSYDTQGGNDSYDEWFPAKDNSMGGAFCVFLLPRIFYVAFEWRAISRGVPLSTSSPTQTQLCVL